MTDDSTSQTDPRIADAIFIHSMAFYALSQMLEEQGIITGGEWANQLRRYKCESHPALENALENFCRELENNPFGPRGTFQLTVIEGGAQKE